MHGLSTLRENSNFLSHSSGKANNNGKSWTRGDSNITGGNISGERGSGQQQNNAISNNINPFKQFAAQSLRQKAAPQIGDLISSLFLPCCNTSPFTQNCTAINPSSTIYAMPCTHGICRRCIQTILYQNNNGDNIPIQCSQCGEQYSSEEAETMFFKNGMAMEIFGKILAVKVKMDEEGGVLRNDTNKGIANKKQFMPSRSLSVLPVHKVHFTRDPEQDQQHQLHIYHPHQQQTIKKHNRANSINSPNITHYLTNPPAPVHTLKQATISSQNSQQVPQFNQCGNIFCHKPTFGFYCSQGCQQLTVELQSVRYEIGNVIIIQQRMS